MKELKDNKRLVALSVVGTLLCVSILMGISYSYYKANENIVNQTESKIETNKLGLIYDGITDIDINDMVPGDSFVKTFKVKNTSSVAVTYNIYMEGITNGFDENLVYTITDTSNNTIVAETPLPVTNSGKTYLKTNISIDPSPTEHNYILTIEYKYDPLNTQNDTQGHEFRGTVGVDTIQS